MQQHQSRRSEAEWGEEWMAVMVGQEWMTEGTELGSEGSEQAKIL
jgi:hypothetical protein